MRGLGRIRAIAQKVQTANSERRKLRWQRQVNPTGQTMPVFLVGNGRSGTSMLVYHLTRSWHIDLYNEDNPAAFDKWFLRDFEVIDGLLEESCAPIALFKPIKDTYRIRTIQARYPHSKVLFAFRHFDDVINSSRKRFYIDFGRKVGKTIDEITPPVDRWMADEFAEYADALPPESTRQFIRSLWRDDLNLESKIALHWLFVNRLFFDLGVDADTVTSASSVQAVLPICYESLVSEPKATFRSVCHFLEIPFTDKMVADVFATSIGKKDAPALDPAIRAACEDLYARLCAVAGVDLASQQFSSLAVQPES